jgi:3-phenylpropionate/trans-cinnamate dioxygenase ferredoxin reductase component
LPTKRRWDKALELRDVIIIGAGEAGTRAALELRAQGFDGRLALVGDERHLPYERPPLSKAAIVGESAGLPAIGDAFRLDELRIERIVGVTAVSIERPERRVLLANGQRLPYDRLVLATGARARSLALPGAECVLTLRTFDDALKIRDRVRSGRRIAIVGGGFIGLELAASARTLGCEVVLFESDSRLLRRSTPLAIASEIEAKHRLEGVEILTGVHVHSFEPAGSSVVTKLADGRSIEADVIIAGVGAVPSTELAAEAGLAVENGIAVTSTLRTSDPHIFAIGDCASFRHSLFDRQRVRLEAWRNAFDHGVHVAKTVLGSEEEFIAVPWFWSDQYDLSLQISGLPGADDEVVRRDFGDGSFVQFHLAMDDRLVGAAGVGAMGKIAKEIRIAERLIARKARPSREALFEPSFNLKKIL